MTKTGKVYLVGAGPGDVGLLTTKGREMLQKAQVVVYDRLVSRDILELIPEEAIRIDVGKYAGRHPVPQERINEILREQALAGRQVVRLKGGDCFLFGRGGEELELLWESGVPFEVVPGIPSALAAPAYGGIPVTHRDFCSSVHIITGHKKEDGELSLDYDALIRLQGTLIFMMSVASGAEIAKGLMTHGMAVSMPCAVVENGTRSEQRTFVTTLQHLEGIIQKERIQSPALIVVGPVCTLAEKFDWFSKLPLKGARLLVTRPKEKEGTLVGRLREAWRPCDQSSGHCDKARTLSDPRPIPIRSFSVHQRRGGEQLFSSSLEGGAGRPQDGGFEDRCGRQGNRKTACHLWASRRFCANGFLRGDIGRRNAGEWIFGEGNSGSC